MPAVAIDPKKCIGDKRCLKVCPTSVFALRDPPDELTFMQEVKLAVHGGKQAYVKNELACIACMECVEACPQDAVTVIP